MENELKVALLLWAPLGLVFVSFGLQFRKDSGAQKFGKVIGAWDSSVQRIFPHRSVFSFRSSSALLVSILPSTILMFLGLYIALFSETYLFGDSLQNYAHSAC